MSSISKIQIDSTIGTILKDNRIRKNLTQEKLAEKLGISLKYISRIENGNSGIKPQTLINYMNVLDITPNTVYGDFIEDLNTKKKLELFDKINNLSDSNFDLLYAIVDLFENNSK